ncbi:hypothetical protein CPC08DRAFT_729224 [Agrocybe pediades]|nr:hypothetical protein CPC08DRAFT_729224 [Agrocybe pediades]
MASSVDNGYWQQGHEQDYSDTNRVNCGRAGSESEGRRCGWWKRRKKPPQSPSHLQDTSKTSTSIDRSPPSPPHNHLGQQIEEEGDWWVERVTVGKNNNGWTRERPTTGRLLTTTMRTTRDAERDNNDAELGKNDSRVGWVKDGGKADERRDVATMLTMTQGRVNGDGSMSTRIVFKVVPDRYFYLVLVL